MHRDIAFVEVRDELGPETGRRHAAQRDKRQSTSQRSLRPIEDAVEHRAVALAEPAHQPIFLFFDLAGHEQRHRGRNQGERQQQSGGKREDDGDRHRMEGFALDALEREDRQIDGGDDDDAEDARLDHLCAGRSDETEAFVAVEQAPEPVLSLAEPAEAVLDDDDGPVDDEAEVERPEAHEVCRCPRLEHARQRHQHRDRNDRRRDQRGPEIAEQQEQDHDDEQRALGEILLHRRNRPLDERGAIVERLGNDTLRQRTRGFDEAFGRGLRHHARILADQHRDRGKDDFLAIFRRGACAEPRADRDIGDVGDPDRNPAAGGDDDLRQVTLIIGLTRHADQNLFAAALDITGPAVGIIGLECGDDIVEREIERGERGRVGCHMILAGIAADRVDLGDPRNRAHLRPDDPIGHRPEVFRRIRRAVGFSRARFGLDREHEDFAEARRDRAHFGLHPGRKLAARGLEPLVDLLAREIDVGPVLEDDSDLAQAIARDRPGIVEVRDARDRGLDRIGDALLGLERRIAFRLGVDLDLDVGNVGNGVDGQFGRAPRADRAEERDDREDEPSLPDRKAYGSG